MFKLNLKKEDFITAQLYFISKSKQVNLALFSNLGTTLLLICLINFIYDLFKEFSNIKNDKFQLFYYLALFISFILLIFFYEKIQKYWYSHFYKIIIEEKFGNDQSWQVSIDFDDTFFYWIDKIGERKISFDAIDKFVKIKNNILIILEDKEILPITLNFDGFDDFINKLKALQTKMGINFIDEKNF